MHAQAHLTSLLLVSVAVVLKDRRMAARRVSPDQALREAGAGGGCDGFLPAGEFGSSTAFGAFPGTNRLFAAGSSFFIKGASKMWVLFISSPVLFILFVICQK